MITIQQAVTQGREQLSNTIHTPHNEALLLLQHATGKTKEFLIAHSDEILEEASLLSYQQYLSRRNQGEPLAYITQQKEFWSLPLRVLPGVLIPRPDTELLVEVALEQISNKNHANILDLGTGSGCIALALAKEKPNATIVACDNSELCIETAKLNAKQLNINNVTFMTSHWFRSITQDNFDVIVSNPPYIANTDDDIQHEVQKYEPESALFAKQEGLFDLFHIIQQAPTFLTAGGSVLIEHGYKQGASVRTQFNDCGYNHTHTFNDMQQHERVTKGTID